METADIKSRELDEHLAPAPESADPAYLAWRDAKVRAAQKEAKDHPEKVVPYARMRERFGL
jgi:hypothetical protein